MIIYGGDNISALSNEWVSPSSPLLQPHPAPFGARLLSAGGSSGGRTKASTWRGHHAVFPTQGELQLGRVAAVWHQDQDASKIRWR